MKILSMFIAAILLVQSVCYAGIGFPFPGPGRNTESAETLGVNFCPNSTFDVLTPWAAHNAYASLAVSGGELVSTGSTASGTGASLAIGLTIGDVYKVTGQVKVASGAGGASIKIVNYAKSAYIYDGSDIFTSAYTTVTFYFTATEVNHWIYLRVSATNPVTVANFDNVEIRTVF